MVQVLCGFVLWFCFVVCFYAEKLFYHGVMTHWRYLLILILVWAGIFLPRLGDLELRGEEGRRILPGLTMIEDGEWAMPKVGGKDYLRKPPLINWMAAGGVLVTGEQDEWSVRFPTVLTVLLFAWGMYGGAVRLLGSHGAFMCAIFSLTNISLLEKGRLTEIEGVYIALTGLALAAWLNGFMKKSMWSAWLGACPFLGLGMLAKGPVHLLFFYGAVIAICWFLPTESSLGRRWRPLYHGAHWIALAVAAGICALWLVPHLQMIPSTTDAGEVWTKQLTGRLDISEIRWGDWLENFPRGVINFFPWALLLIPVYWLSPPEGIRTEPLKLACYKGLRAGTAITFLLVLMIPESNNRYVMPLIPMAAVLVAMVLVYPFSESWKRMVQGIWSRSIQVLACVIGVGALVAPFLHLSLLSVWLTALLVLAGAVFLFLLFRGEQGKKNQTFLRLTCASAAVFLLVFSIYFSTAMPILVKLNHLQKDADVINRTVPAHNTIHVYDPGFQDLFFYVKPHLEYVTTKQDMPENIEYFLLRELHVPGFRSRKELKNGKLIATVPDLDKKPMLLYRVTPQ